MMFANLVTIGRLYIVSFWNLFSCAPKGSRNQKHVLRPESLEGTDEEDPVTALEWDPLSTDYLLVANLHNGIRLVDSESLSCITTFNFPSAAASVQCLAWVSSAPGMFVTGGKPFCFLIFTKVINKGISNQNWYFKTNISVSKHLYK